MNKTKQLVLIPLLLMIVFYTNAKTPINGNPDVIATNVVERMDKDVTLSADQKASIHKIIVKYITQINSADDAQIEPLSLSKNAAIDSVLTSAQREQLTARRKARFKALKSSK